MVTYAISCIKYCIVNLLHGIGMALNQTIASNGRIFSRQWIEKDMEGSDVAKFGALLLHLSGKAEETHAVSG
jgi:hypothetical protein